MNFKCKCRTRVEGAERHLHVRVSSGTSSGSCLCTRGAGVGVDRGEFGDFHETRAHALKNANCVNDSCADVVNTAIVFGLLDGLFVVRPMLVNDGENTHEIYPVSFRARVL